MPKKSKKKATKKANKRPSQKKHMAKKGKSRGSFGMGGIKGALTSGPIGNVAKGLGTAAIVGLATDRIVPQWSPIAKIGAAAMGGGLIGAAAQAILGGGLGGILGGGGNGSGDSI